MNQVESCNGKEWEKEEEEKAFYTREMAKFNIENQGQTSSNQHLLGDFRFAKKQKDFRNEK